MVDARKGITQETEHILEGLKPRTEKTILVLNKVDLVKKETLLPLAQQLHNTGLFKETFMISALKGEGVEGLKQYLVANAPKGPWHFPEDQLTDLSERLFVSEIVREQLFLQLQQELPYSLTVETESWEEQPDGSVRIQQLIVVQRESQKKIIVGKGGARLKAVGTAARRDIEKA